MKLFERFRVKFGNRRLALTTLCIVAVSFVISQSFVSPVSTEIYSASELSSRGAYPTVGASFRPVVLDGFTDGMMLNVAYTFDHTQPITSFISANIAQSPNSPHDQAKNLVAHIDGSANYVSYERYWHGYILYLRPLLSVTPYEGVRALSIILGWGSVIWLGYQASKHRQTQVFIAWFVAYMLTDSYAIFSNVHLSLLVVFTNFLLAWLVSREKFSSQTWILVAAGIGFFTAFFDFLSYPVLPILTLAMYIIFRWNFTWKTIFLGLAVWFVAYAGLWGAKIGIAYLAGHTSAIDTLIMKLAERTTGSTDPEFSRFEAVKRNVYQLIGYSRVSQLLIAMTGGVWLWFAYSTRLFSRLFHEKSFKLVVLAALPYLWYFLAAEHSFTHVLFTYRAQFPTIFAATLLLFHVKKV